MNWDLRLDSEPEHFRLVSRIQGEMQSSSQIKSVFIKKVHVYSICTGYCK